MSQDNKKKKARDDFEHIMESHPRYVLSPLMYHPEGYTMRAIIVRGTYKRIANIIYKK